MTNNSNGSNSIRPVPTTDTSVNAQKFHSAPTIKENSKFSSLSSDSFKAEIHDKQNWAQVDMVAWILLLCIAFECFVEGIAFALTLRDEVGSGIAILIAMIIKLIPQKFGNAVILTKAGLNHTWENVLSLLSVSFV